MLCSCSLANCLAHPLFLTRIVIFFGARTSLLAATNTFQPNCILLKRSFKHAVDVAGAHSPSLKMSAPSPIKGTKICVRLTPRLVRVGMSTGSVSICPAPPVSRVLQRGWNSCVLWASRIMNIQRDLQRSSFRAGEFTEISELTCAVLESAFLTFKPFSPVYQGQTKTSQRDRGTEFAAQKLGVCCNTI